MKKVMLWSMLFFMVAALMLAATDDGMGRDPKKNVNSPLLKIAGTDRPLWAPNRIGDYITNNGQIVSHIPTGSAGMEWPYRSTNHINYASGIWIAGVKNGEIVTAAGEYAVEFQPGVIKADGTADDPGSSRYKVYIINQDDVDNPTANPDYVNWPGVDGAPVNADGTPQILGTSTTWAVFNDLDEVLHGRLFGSKPMGVEVQQTAFAFNRADVFGDMLFFKFKIINKSGVNIDSTFVSFWADVDVGDAADLVGCDTTLSLGYNYKTQADAQYGAVSPAIGYDFFQGPIVPGSPTDTALVSGRRIPGYRNLPMTSFGKYINGGAPQYSDPEIASEAYSFMNGFDKVGDPIINPLTNQSTKFWHTGDPAAGTGWLDDSHADKRFLMSSGPFTLAAGDTQEVVGGMVIAQGPDAPSTIRLLKQADESAQVAYNNDFILPATPPVPNVEFSTEDDAILLQWDARAETYEALDKFHVVNGVPTNYRFQGYNVYQLDEQSIGTGTTIKKIATFDIIDGNFQDIKDFILDSERGEFVEVTVQKPRDTGVQRHLRITQDALRGNQPLIPNRQYYFSVTAYGYNQESFDANAGGPYAIESTFRPVVVNPVGPTLGDALPENVAYGDTVASSRVSGPSDGSITPIIVDRTALTGHDYEVRFRNTPAGSVYDVWDVTTNVRKDSNRTNQGDATGPLDYPIVDGVLIKVIGAPNDYKDFLTVANAAGPLSPPEYGAFAFNGSGFPHPTTADRPAPRAQSTVTLGAQGWGIHTGEVGGGILYSYFLTRVARNDNFSRIVPNDFELRFTAAGGKGIMAFTTETLVDVPFELWNIGIGTPDDPSDDYRMIPWINDADGNDVFNIEAIDHSISGGDNDPQTDWIYWRNPANRLPGTAGYDQFVADATAGTYDFASPEVMARMVLVFWNGGSVSDPTYPANLPLTMPETGTVFRLVSTKPNSPSDVFTFKSVAPVKNNAALAKNQAAMVNVFPNPYRGFNIEARNPIDQFVTFTHLTPTAKIRIYTLAGELIRTIEHTDGTQLERWDMRNSSNVRVASGIYIAHIELPGVGNRVLKVAMFTEEERIDTF